MGQVQKTVTAIDRFYTELAYKPWCGEDKAARLVRPKATAVSKPYIAPNPPALVHWLVFDLDHPNSWIWQDKNLPEPNLIVTTPHTGRSHLYYAISPVCVSDNAREAPIAYMKAVYRALAKGLEADIAYNGRIAKNPLSKYWNTLELHSFQYNLNDLAEGLVLEVVPFHESEEANIDIPEGRNNALFHRLRHWAYANVARAKTTGSFDNWDAAILKRALSLADIEPDFGYNEIKNTAKSVSAWTWCKYAGSGIDRGVMKLGDTDLPLENRQRLAARRTHTIRAEATERRIRDAIGQLSQVKARVTKTAVAALCGVSRQQLSRRYAHLFDSPPLADIQPFTSENISPISVLYAVHQITAGLPGMGLDVSGSAKGFDNKVIIDIDIIDDG